MYAKDVTLLVAVSIVVQLYRPVWGHGTPAHADKRIEGVASQADRRECYLMTPNCVRRGPDDFDFRRRCEVY